MLAKIISNEVFDLAQEINDLLMFNFKDSVKRLVEGSQKSYDECEAFLEELCNDYEEEEMLLMIRQFLA